MRIRAIVCRQCGAPLDPPFDVELVCCEFCGSQFRPDIRIGPRPARSTTEAHAAPPTLAERRILDELDDLDRTWESHRGGFLRRKADGHYNIPVPKHCRVGAWIAATAGLSVGGGLLWFAVADEVALVVILGTAFLTIVLLYRARVGCIYQRRLADYRVARRNLLERLRTARDLVCEESRA